MTEPTLSLHSHTVYSQRDSICAVDKIVGKVVANGGTHYAVTDHGTVQGWLTVRDCCKKNKIIPILGIELYVNPFIHDILQVLKERDAAPKKEQARVVLKAIKERVIPKMSPAQLVYFTGKLNDPKDLADTSKQLLQRLTFGYEHLVAVATTEEGRNNLIKLQNLGWISGHYYKPQVTWDQVLQYSNGVTYTSACLGGPLAKRFVYDPSGASGIKFLDMFKDMKDRFYLEVQPLDLLQQRRYNSHVITLAEKSGFPLILSQDNHHINEEDWISHRILMLSQNDKSIDLMENVYRYKGRDIDQSDFKGMLGVTTNWQVEEFIEQEKLELVRASGHHYGDVKLHWRVNDEVRKQCVTTNPELLPVLDRCFAETTKLCQTIKDIPWQTKHHIPHHEDARKLALTVCIGRIRELGLLPKRNDGTIALDEDGNSKVDIGQSYMDWLMKEDKVITACGFWDYIWTLYKVTKKVQEEGIPIGYARGSGGGCLVMYLLGIIRVDPVKYGLYFERFLNPARLGLDPKTLEKKKEMVSCPDADLDFSSLKRDRVIEICREIFGTERVAPVGTNGEAKIRTAFADICRVLGIPPVEFMAASKELPDDINGTMTFDEAIEKEKFKEFIDKYPIIKASLPSLIGVVRSTGTHASGICISDTPLDQNIPLVMAGAKDGGSIVTAFGESGSERALESIGYIKFDILATITVDHVSLCARSLHDAHLKAGGSPWVKPGEKMLYPEQIPSFHPDDPYVMRAIFYPGNTDGIFQFEEAVGKQMSSLVKPDTVGELSDISTMIRPGCLQAKCSYVPQGSNIANLEGVGLHNLYSARKFNSSCNPPPKLPQPVLDVLKPTHYCCIYQEQMMFLIETITGGAMSLGEGDIYRRAIEHGAKGKKDAQETVIKMEAEMKAKAVYPAEIVDEVCAIIKGGAAYSFNKAHALAYSLFTYAQGWFKHYYPHVFVASHVTLLAADNKLDKLHKIVNNARSMGISIKPPHVRYSSNEASWSEDQKTVFLPYTVIKGLKGETAEALPRIALGCTNLLDFLLKSRKEPSIKKNHIINLARIGGFDDMGIKFRNLIVATMCYVLARVTVNSSDEDVVRFYNDTREFNCSGEGNREDKVEAEIDVFGSFINESPLDKIVDFATKGGWIPLTEVVPEKDKRVKVYFMVTSIAKKVHKQGKSAGKEWLKLTCWDGKNVGDLSIWSHELEDSISERMGNKKIDGYKKIIEPNQCYFAVVQSDGDRPVSLASRFIQDKITNVWTEEVTLMIKNPRECQ